MQQIVALISGMANLHPNDALYISRGRFGLHVFRSIVVSRLVIFNLDSNAFTRDLFLPGLSYVAMAKASFDEKIVLDNSPILKSQLPRALFAYVVAH